MSEINVCDICGKPLISTMMFPSAEWFCLCCGKTYDIFGGKEVKLTATLKKQKEKIDKDWDKISVNLLTGGVMKTWCKKCRGKGKPHLRHATKKELENHNKSLSELKKYCENE